MEANSNSFAVDFIILPSVASFAAADPSFGFLG